MSNVDDDLRKLLRRRANQVPPHREVPRSLVSRAHRRIALNALVVGVSVVVLVVGTLTGLRAFRVASPRQPAGGPDSSFVQPTPSTSTASACTSAQLRAVGSMQGAAGSREGAIVVTNFSDVTCTVQGTPSITLLDENLDPITSDVKFASSPPGWKVYGSPEPAGWPVVTLAPGDPASVRIRWSNWCPAVSAPLWRIEVPGGGTIDVNGLEAVSPPPCNGQGEPSTIEVGPFEPGGGG